MKLLIQIDCDNSQMIMLIERYQPLSYALWRSFAQLDFTGDAEDRAGLVLDPTQTSIGTWELSMEDEQ